MVVQKRNHYNSEKAFFVQTVKAIDSAQCLKDKLSLTVSTESSLKYLNAELPYKFVQRSE